MWYWAAVKDILLYFGFSTNFQGLNRLAAIALLFLNEEDAFWCLVCIVEYIMPQEYYTTTLMAAQVDQVSVFGNKILWTIVERIETVPLDYSFYLPISPI